MTRSPDIFNGWPPAFRKFCGGRIILSALLSMYDWVRMERLCLKRLEVFLQVVSDVPECCVFETRITIVHIFGNLG